MTQEAGITLVSIQFAGSVQTQLASIQEMDNKVCTGLERLRSNLIKEIIRERYNQEEL